MQDLRIVLIIIGAIAIGALLVHGYLTNRRNNPKPIKDRPFKKVGGDPAPVERQTDEQGFDADGIGQVRVLNRAEPGEKIEPAWSDELPEPEDDAVSTAPVSEPATQAAEIAPSEDVPQQEEKKPSAEEPRGEASSETPTGGRDEARRQQSTEPQDVFVLNVVGGERPLQGAELLPVLLTLGLKYGEMNIFHRHQDSAGNGKVLFSLANMVKPGVFDLDTMEQFETPGVSLFMTVPCAGDAMANFKLMLQAAEKLADELGGQLLDGHRNPLTQQMVQHYANRIREFERRRLLAG